MRFTFARGVQLFQIWHKHPEHTINSNTLVWNNKGFASPLSEYKGSAEEFANFFIGVADASGEAGKEAIIPVDISTVAVYSFEGELPENCNMIAFGSEEGLTPAGYAEDSVLGLLSKGRATSVVLMNTGSLHHQIAQDAPESPVVESEPSTPVEAPESAPAPPVASQDVLPTTTIPPESQGTILNG